jgi:CubicO group peptidase (beta-lactamase class C family)
VLGSDPGRVPSGVTLDNWQESPHLHWSFQHIADLFPTQSISRGLGPVADLPWASSSIGDVVVSDPPEDHPWHWHWPRHGHHQRTVADVMASTGTDGWAVWHAGSLLAEEYLAGMEPFTPHILMSVSKSLVGSVAGALVAAGVLDVDAPLTAYVPALGASGYAGATVRHLLDMRSGIRFSEAYLDEDAEVRIIEEAIGWAPRTHAGVPTTMYDYLLTLAAKGPHGGPFDYRSCETDVLGWVLEGASGIRMSDLMSELLWSRIGAEWDANIGVDSAGAGMFDGGISTALRDLVRFGSMIAGEGVSLTGAQVLPASWVADTFAGGPDSREAFAASDSATLMPGGMYRNQFWAPSPDPDVLLCLGIHGQMVYINRRTQLVGAKFSSWSTPQDAGKLFSTLHAFDAVSTALSP